MGSTGPLEKEEIATCNSEEASSMPKPANRKQNEFIVLL
jgi:hypothetical protein